MANEELISFSKKKPTIHTMFKGAPRPLLYSSRYGSGATCSIKLVLDEVLPSIEVDDVVAKSDAATESSKLLQLMGAPLLLIISTFFACLFVILLAIYKFNDSN